MRVLKNLRKAISIMLVMIFIFITFIGDFASYASIKTIDNVVTDNLSLVNQNTVQSESKINTASLEDKLPEEVMKKLSTNNSKQNNVAHNNDKASNSTNLIDTSANPILHQDNTKIIPDQKPILPQNLPDLNNNSQVSNNVLNDPAHFLLPGQTSVQDYKTNRFIIKYKNETGRKEIGQAIKDRIKATRKINNHNNQFDEIVTNTSSKASDILAVIKQKKADTNIEYIQPDYKVQLSSNDTYYNQQWGLNNNNNTLPNLLNPITTNPGQNKIDANVVTAWDRSQGEGINVAVIDTGIDITHEDLSKNIWKNTAEISGNGVDDDGNGYIDDINGWNFIENTNKVHDISQMKDEEHGTHVSGIIGTLKDNNEGIAGVAPKGKIMPLKVFKNGTAYTSDIIDAIDYAGKMGAQIANCSWGSTKDNPALKETIENSNMLFVCAAGNSGTDIDKNPVYPASFEGSNMITVASINRKGQLSSLSNYGENSVDVAAPGDNIISTVPGNEYYEKSGTSMAAAFVTGEAALILGQNRNISSIELKQKIIESSDKLSSLIGKVYGGYKINCNNGVSDTSNNTIIQIDGSNYSSVTGSNRK